MTRRPMDACRACGAADPLPFLDMGDHPPANLFVHPGETKPEPCFPLVAQACLACGLIQVADQVPPGFFSHYLYVPSGAATMHTHFGALAGELVARAGGGLIVDIGCNDGLLLSACNARGGRTLGIDPAANLALIANDRGVGVHVAPFTPAVAREVREVHGPAKVIVTTNTFNHIGDLHAFMEGIGTLLADDGAFVIEVPWSKDLVEKNEFDTIYHEHVSEFSLASVACLGEAAGLAVVDVTKLPVHGGSMRIVLQRAELGLEPRPAVAAMLEEERAADLFAAETYHALAARVASVGTQLKAMLADLRAEGRTVAGYGAPAKGNTLLNHFGLGPDDLLFLVDRNPLKHGLLTPGMHIPVRPVEALREERPDVLLVLAWNFFDEIREQLADFEATGGQFLVPLPSPRLVGGGGAVVHAYAPAVPVSAVA